MSLHDASISEMQYAASNGNVEELRKLLEQGCSVNEDSRHGHSPLTAAAAEGHTDCVQWLIENGADLEGTYLHKTALDWAAECGHYATVELLLRHNAAPNCAVLDEETLLVHAAGGFHLDLKRGSKGRTALHLAVCNGHDPIVQLLLQHKADPNVRDVYGDYPLTSAAIRGHVKIVELLLSYGAETEQSESESTADLDRRGNKMHVLPFLVHDENTPLIWAAMGGHVDAVRMLLNHGTNLGQKDRVNKTALHWAAEKGHHSTVELLLQHKADPNVEDDGGDTPLICAARGGLVADADGGGSTTYYLPVMERLVEHVEARFSFQMSERWDKYKMTLREATGKEHCSVVEILLLHGAKVEHKGSRGRTALHWAVENGHHSLVELLLQHNADPNIKDRDKNTSLDLAIRKKHTDIVKLIARHDTKDSQNMVRKNNFILHQYFRECQLD